MPVYILLLFYTADRNCSLRDLSPSLVEQNRVCGVVSGGGVCYSGDSVGSVAVYFCTDGYSLEGDTARECLSNGLWNGSTPQCVEKIRGKNEAATSLPHWHCSTLPPHLRPHRFHSSHTSAPLSLLALA